MESFKLIIFEQPWFTVIEAHAIYSENEKFKSYVWYWQSYTPKMDKIQHWSRYIRTESVRELIPEFENKIAGLKAAKIQDEIVYYNPNEFVEQIAELCANNLFEAKFKNQFIAEQIPGRIKPLETIVFVQDFHWPKGENLLGQRLDFNLKVINPHEYLLFEKTDNGNGIKQVGSPNTYTLLN